MSEVPLQTLPPPTQLPGTDILGSDVKSMSLKYEPASEPLHITVK